jgi:hypothetical protein
MDQRVTAFLNRRMARCAYEMLGAAPLGNLAAQQGAGALAELIWLTAINGTDAPTYLRLTPTDVREAMEKAVHGVWDVVLADLAGTQLRMPDSWDSPQHPVSARVADYPTPLGC